MICLSCIVVEREMQSSFSAKRCGAMAKNTYCSKRAMVSGARVAGQVLLAVIQNAHQSPYERDKYVAQFDSVCIIDNDPKNRILRLWV